MLGRCRTAIILLATFAFILAFALPSQAVLRIFEGVVKKVADEDTLTVALRDAAQLRVRLWGTMYISQNLLRKEDLWTGG